MLKGFTGGEITPQGRGEKYARNLRGDGGAGGRRTSGGTPARPAAARPAPPRPAVARQAAARPPGCRPPGIRPPGCRVNVFPPYIDPNYLSAQSTGPHKPSYFPGLPVKMITCPPDQPDKKYILTGKPGNMMVFMNQCFGVPKTVIYIKGSQRDFRLPKLKLHCVYVLPIGF